MSEMFTGLIQGVACIKQIKQLNDTDQTLLGKKITLELPITEQNKLLTQGDSISINGACQTIEKIHNNTTFDIFSIPDTLKTTNFHTYKESDAVNFEFSLQFSSYLGGHIVQGHIDDTATILNIKKYETYWDIYIENQKPEYIMLKGSITLNGISLTIQEVTSDYFKVQIIPETLKKTNISSWQIKDTINIEYDHLIKIVEHLLKYQNGKNQL